MPQKGMFRGHKSRNFLLFRLALTSSLGIRRERSQRREGGFIKNTFKFGFVKHTPSEVKMGLRQQNLLEVRISYPGRQELKVPEQK